MPRTNPVKPYQYQWLARYYDEFFSSMRLPADAAREKLLSRILPNVHTACDLACGTGSTALSLAKTGIEMYAVDQSRLMCRQARKKAADAGLRLRVLQADMRSFRLPKAVDLITCEFDALNHVPRKAHLREVTRAVARALCAGGYFFFDVNNSLGFKRYWTGAFWMEKPGVVMVMRNGHTPQGDRAWSDVEFFVQQGRLWRRHQERVEEVCWDAGEMRLALKEAGFDQVRAWDAARFFEDDSLIASGCRTFYLARKALS
jgi:SAM-dependent methyltransferase